MQNIHVMFSLQDNGLGRPNRKEKVIFSDFHNIYMEEKGEI
jgi:K+-sensing histidine kinase KdpD